MLIWLIKSIVLKWINQVFPNPEILGEAAANLWLKNMSSHSTGVRMGLATGSSTTRRASLLDQTAASTLQTQRTTGSRSSGRGSRGWCCSLVLEQTRPNEIKNEIKSEKEKPRLQKSGLFVPNFAVTRLEVEPRAYWLRVIRLKCLWLSYNADCCCLLSDLKLTTQYDTKQHPTHVTIYSSKKTPTWQATIFRNKAKYETPKYQQSKHWKRWY